mmetsp:Transcript_10951/g.9683  ORF Transcript_10951/g.9683 Transcript_10951/m.9683 type:complete len:170 (+) Transcript_10951:23-532(+)
MDQGSNQDFTLEGNWQGEGVVINSKGEEKLNYKETLEIKLVKTAPVNIYMITSSTFKNDDSNMALHFETGFIKLLPGDEGSNKVEASFTHPFSVNEFSFGTYTHASKELNVEAKKENLMRGNTAQGQMTTGIRREYTVDDSDSLTFKMYLGIDDKEPYHHLTGKLSRVS